MKDIQSVLFNYNGMDAETTTYLQQNAHETRVLLKRTTEDIIRIGQNLMEAKARLPHGQFLPWIKAELGISQSTAWRFMQVAQGKEIKKSFTVNDLIAQISAPAEEHTVEAKPSRSDMIPYSLLGPWETGNPKGNAVRGVISIGQLLCKLFEDASLEEVEEFAWTEFRLLPSVTSQYMLYGSRFPNPTGMLTPKVFDALVALDAQRNETVDCILGFLVNVEEGMKRILDIGRGCMLMQHRWRDTPHLYTGWIHSNFRFSEEVAEILIGYVCQYAGTPASDIPSGEIIWGMADTWTRHALYNVLMKFPGSEVRV